MLKVFDQPRDRKFFQLLNLAALVFAILKVAFGDLLSRVVAIFLIVVCYIGFFGSFFNHKKALLMYLIANGAMLAVSIISIAVSISVYNNCPNPPVMDQCVGNNDYKSGAILFAIIVSFIVTFFQAACTWFGFALWKA